MLAGLEILKDNDKTDTSRIAAIGYCFGGTGVLELARAGTEIAGVVSFHGGLSAAPDMAAEKGDIPARSSVCMVASIPTFLPGKSPRFRKR